MQCGPGLYIRALLASSIGLWGDTNGTAVAAVIGGCRCLGERQVTLLLIVLSTSLYVSVAVRIKCCLLSVKYQRAPITQRDGASYITRDGGYGR